MIIKGPPPTHTYTQLANELVFFHLDQKLVRRHVEALALQFLRSEGCHKLTACHSMSRCEDTYVHGLQHPRQWAAIPSGQPLVQSTTCKLPCFRGVPRGSGTPSNAVMIHYLQFPLQWAAISPYQPLVHSTMCKLPSSQPTASCHTKWPAVGQGGALAPAAAPTTTIALL